MKLLTDEEQAQLADRIAELYEELAEARDAVSDIENELRQLGEEPVS